MPELVGWLAAGLTLATFSMRSMGALRLTAIGSNLCFIAYGLIAGLAPVLALHLLLLPCNIVRLIQLRRAERRRGGALLPARRLPSAASSRAPAGSAPSTRATAAPAARRRLIRPAALAWAVGAALVLAPSTAASDDPGSGCRPADEAPLGIVVVLHAVRCTSDLLECRDVVIVTPEFHAMVACRRFVQGFWAHAALAETPPDGRLLLRCRYDPALARVDRSIDETAQRPPARRRPSAGPTR